MRLLLGRYLITTIIIIIGCDILAAVGADIYKDIYYAVASVAGIGVWSGDSKAFVILVGHD